MSKETEKKKKEQLGVAYGTARNQLNKKLMFHLAQKLDMDYCYQCAAKIESSAELSIEHMTPWLDSDSPRELFFDIDNIAFSHHSCNVGAARQPLKREDLDEKGLAECRTCGIKPKDEFVKRANKWNGVDNECKECKR